MKKKLYQGFKIEIKFFQAFSAVAVQEYWRNKEEKYANLSEQSILDCNNFSDDCAGGMSETFKIN